MVYVYSETLLAVAKLTFGFSNCFSFDLGTGIRTQSPCLLGKYCSADVLFCTILYDMPNMLSSLIVFLISSVSTAMVDYFFP